MTLTAKQLVQVNSAAPSAKAALRARFNMQNAGNVPGTTRDAKQRRARGQVPPGPALRRMNTIAPSRALAPAPRGRAGPIASADNHHGMPKPFTMSAFSDDIPCRNFSESRSFYARGMVARQLANSMGTFHDLDCVAANPADCRLDLEKPAIVLDATQAQSIPIPTTILFMPSNSAVAFRVYSPIINVTTDPSTGNKTYFPIGIASEDYGCTALGTQAEYLNQVEGDKPAGYDAIVDSSPGKLSFRLRNVTARLNQGGTVRQLRMATGMVDPLWESNINYVYYGAANGQPYYRKAVSYVNYLSPDWDGKFPALQAYEEFYTGLNSSAAFIASSGADFQESRQGNCTVLDQVAASAYKDTNSVAKQEGALSRVYGRKSPAKAGIKALSMYSESLVGFRSQLLLADPSPVTYDLDWTQDELRQNFLTGAAFPYGSWPNFGNIGFTTDPLTLVGNTFRFPASGGVDYEVVAVNPAEPDGSGKIYSNTTPLAPPPAATAGFTPVGTGWDKIDIPNLLAENKDLMKGLRYKDNVSGVTFIIASVSPDGVVNSTQDGPGIESMIAADVNPEIKLDPFTAELMNPSYTPFAIVLDVLPYGDLSGIGSTANLYEITAQIGQFTHFNPGTILANTMTPQPASTQLVQQARNREELKGSSLAKVTAGVMDIARKLIC